MRSPQDSLEPVAVIGWGRFGRAVGERLLEGGTRVRAWDPRAPMPTTVAAKSAADAVRGAAVVLLTVPVPSTASVLRELRPHFDAQSLILEAGSVKSGPIAALESVLGDDFAWAATHPLFGPVSLALGERPLRVVVCPRARQPAATARAEEFWRALGCEILRMDPEPHDRAMAQSHALAFFVAKGFLDCGFELESEFAPPSVSGIARTVRSAREDAGQLFATLHRENPYSNDARARLLDALQAVDAALRAPPAPGERAHEEGETLRLAELDEPPPELRAARERIDALDQELLRLIAQRAELALRAGRAKAEVGRGVRDPRREEELLASRSAGALALGLDPEAVSEIFRSIMNLSRAHQSRKSS